MVIVVILLFGSLAAAGWAVCFHRTAFHVVHRPDPGERVAVPLRRQSSCPAVAEAGIGHDGGFTRAAVDQLEAIGPPMASEPVSVLGWDRFVVLSILLLDGSAMLACRRMDSPGASKAAGFDERDQTIVLRLGDDHRAGAALAVFDDWRQRRTPLRLRPIEVAGAIEILDAAHTRIRAPLTGA